MPETAAATDRQGSNRRVPNPHPMSNRLYFGDNLEILRRHVADASVDLIYLDPPFNSNRDYNVLFKEQSGHGSPAQIKAFDDTWNWAGAAESWHRFHELCPAPKVIELMQGFFNTLGQSDVMAYLVMMAPRLYELRRVLKGTGSLYLHCDPTASAYLRLLLDALFGAENFRNEISWKRSNPKSHSSRNFPNCRDVLLRYTRSDSFTFNRPFGPHDPAYTDRAYRHVDADGRRYRLLPLLTPNDNRPNLTYEFLGVHRVWRWTKDRMQRAYDEGLVVQQRPGAVPQYIKYLDESEGRTITNDWSDIRPPSEREALGYPTQKPLALLERIIRASSNEGGVVLDPFCGCGTAVVAAEGLNRQWIGIDITPIATSLIQKRLYDLYRARDVRRLETGDPPERAFEVIGLPVDTDGAREMWRRDHKALEMWAVGLVPAIPQEKKGADQGIDGVAYFNDNPKRPSKAIVQVKGGKIGSAQVRDLKGAMAREKAQMGFFICLERPTKAMKEEALSAGYHHPEYALSHAVEAVQIRTVEELLSGNGFDVPVFSANVSLKHASGRAAERGRRPQAVEEDEGSQGELEL